jgi:hypothetical protein
MIISAMQEKTCVCSLAQMIRLRQQAAISLVAGSWFE